MLPLSCSYSRVAYCDVTGRESRLPLKIRGEGVGPRLQFSFDTLDIQNVFVNSAHAYEVCVRNQKFIQGATLSPSLHLYGRGFSINASGVVSLASSPGPRFLPSCNRIKRRPGNEAMVSIW